MSIHTNYLTSVLDLAAFRKNITAAKKKLKNLDFDAFAVSGNSGTLMGGAGSGDPEKKLILVRKPSDNSHSSYTIEGDDSVSSFMFLDDQVSTGATKTRVVEEVRAWLPNVVFRGTYLYNHSKLDYIAPPKPPKKKKVVRKVVRKAATKKKCPTR
jgi:hypothetical protein